jgi:hypothetical protein
VHLKKGFRKLCATVQSERLLPTLGEGVLAFHRCNVEGSINFTRKYLSADGLHKTVKHSLLREQFKVIKNSEYSWQDCIMSGLAVFGFKMPSLLQFEKDKASEPWIRRNLRTLYGVEQAPSDTCMRERLYPSLMKLRI